MRKVHILGILLLLGLTLLGCSRNTETPPSTQAADFTLRGLDGQAVSLSKLRGRPVLLNFWATWCGPCRSEMGYFQELFSDKKWTDKGLVILAVDVGESAAVVDSFVKDNKLTFTVLLDADQSVAQKYNIRYFPTTFFIDKDGIIENTKIGAFTSKQEVENELKQIVP